VTVKQNQKGKWSVQVDRKGIPRVRRTCFKSQEDAEQFEREHITKHSHTAPKKRDKSVIGSNHCYTYVINVHLHHHQTCSQ
jgi:hypothetical protein